MTRLSEKAIKPKAHALSQTISRSAGSSHPAQGLRFEVTRQPREENVYAFEDP